MTINQTKEAAQNVNNYTDRDAYVSNVYLSSAFEQTSSPTALDLSGMKFHSVFENWEESLSFDEVIREVAEAVGLSTAAKKLDIPYRTMQNWKAGLHLPPKYVQKLVVEKIARTKWN